MSTKKIVLIALIIVVLLVGYYTLTQETDEEKAWRFSTQYVEKQLYNPESAYFCSMENGHVFETGDGEYDIIGRFTAEDVDGFERTVHYNIRLEFLGKGYVVNYFEVYK
jgi:hypothetical protein